MLSLSVSCVQLKHLSSAVRSILNYRHVSKITINLSVLETPCRDFKEFKQVISQMILTGFIKNTYAANRLLQFSTCELPFIHIDYSYQIFNVIENPNASIYNIMLMTYVRRNYSHRAIHFYKLMLYRNVGPNVYTYPFLIGACAVRKSHFEGEQMHNHVLKLGFDSDVDIRSIFVDMYADCCNYDDARKVFDEGPMMDSFIWYSLLEVCMRFDLDVEDMEDIYNLMPEKSAIASSFMIASFSCLGTREQVEQLINKIPENDTVSWSALINHYGELFNEMYGEALDLFIKMHANGVTIDELVLEAVWPCCIELARLDIDVRIMGKLIHSLGVKIGIECDVEFQNSLICMYSTFRNFWSAQNLFNSACWLDQSSWSYMLRSYVECGLDENVEALFESMPEKIRLHCGLIMITYYSEHDCFSESLALFQKMVGSGEISEVGWYTIIMELPCGFAFLDLGKCIHACLIKKGYSLENSLGNGSGLDGALFRMYRRSCGYERSDKRGLEEVSG
ncbi:hypothetical protein FNV43_RR03456 [Rhamnella rubrinervis]|uniref:Pentatricopeptide repeat-containing protein n=1 Tax=Rhamnella rubrinervis TaxID=2594499 RepID=A0A8K0MPB6_9ROSA|nr:hypothetical protein FNV43_RR03456 [Rhamnella rubrinervis]